MELPQADLSTGLEPRRNNRLANVLAGLTVLTLPATTYLAVRHYINGVDALEDNLNYAEQCQEYDEAVEAANDSITFAEMPDTFFRACFGDTRENYYREAASILTNQGTFVDETKVEEAQFSLVNTDCVVEKYQESLDRKRKLVWQFSEIYPVANTGMIPFLVSIIVRNKKDSDRTKKPL